MTSTSARLQEVRSYFTNGDYHVGYRRLLDSAIETQDTAVFEYTLAFCDWYDQFQVEQQKDPTVLLEKVDGLLEKITGSPASAPPSTAEPVIRLANVSKTYHSGSFGLKDINFDLHAGQIIGLVGENGNGKTTLLRLIYGELQPDSGSVKYKLDELPADAPFYDTKTRLSFIPQRPNPWYGSLMANLQFTATHYGFKGRDNILWAEMVCARMGLRAYRGFSWSRISSGYKMRFELAKALIKKPQVLLLDEPLANLDMLAQQVILEDLRYLAQSEKMPIGVILSSQQLYEVEKVSEQVVFLKNGHPKYQRTITSPAEDTAGEQLVFEIETTAGREQLQQVFPAGLQNISFNGGVYLLYFDAGADASSIITRLGESKIPVKYFRDISSSSRRFFNA
ncbi:MAG: ABC transporter ATP-binding protein [Chitinophagaceae bacterium]|nr:MAG: ABC transporter ATP-binding protein [Chitinophagaceae bacterium]